MDLQEIKILLDRFNKAETTLDEEQLLRNYFAQHSEVPEELKSYQGLFLLLSSMRNQETRLPDLEKRWENIIDNQAENKPVIDFKNRLFRYASIAAAVALLISLSFIFVNKSGKPDPGTYKDPQIAYVEAQKALLFISQKLNYGTKDLSTISKLNTGLDDLKNLEKLNSGMDKLKMISKLDNSQNNENN